MSQNNPVYNKLVETVKVKFANELHNTDIHFEDIFVAKDLLTNQKLYILVANQCCIRFISPSNFIDNFSAFLVESIRSQQKEYERLKKLENEFTDELPFDIAIKKQWDIVYYQKELLKKIYELGTQIENQDF